MNTGKCVRCKVEIPTKYNRCVRCAEIETALPDYLQNKNARMFVMNLMALMARKNVAKIEQGTLFEEN